MIDVTVTVVATPTGTEFGAAAVAPIEAAIAGTDVRAQTAAKGMTAPSPFRRAREVNINSSPS
jgi:hypothetical protein